MAAAKNGNGSSDGFLADTGVKSSDFSSFQVERNSYFFRDIF